MSKEFTASTMSITNVESGLSLIKEAIMDSDYALLKEVFDSQEFQEAKERLVKHYNITASAKSTLEPRDDFIFKVIREFVEVAVK